VQHGPPTPPEHEQASGYGKRDEGEVEHNEGIGKQMRVHGVGELVATRVIESESGDPICTPAVENQAQPSWRTVFCSGKSRA
jgi:hypothetical protein